MNIGVHRVSIIQKANVLRIRSSSKSRTFGQPATFPIILNQRLSRPHPGSENGRQAFVKTVKTTDLYEFTMWHDLTNCRSINERSKPVLEIADRVSRPINSNHVTTQQLRHLDALQLSSLY